MKRSFHMYHGGSLISRIHKLTNRKINSLLKEEKIDAFNNAQGTIIYALWDKDALSITEISNITCLAMSSLTTMLERMRQKGLIEMKSDPKDGRSTLVSLSTKGREVSSSFEKITDEMFESYYHGFSEEEVVLFEGMLERVLKNLEDRR